MSFTFAALSSATLIRLLHDLYLVIPPSLGSGFLVLMYNATLPSYRSMGKGADYLTPTTSESERRRSTLEISLGGSNPLSG